MNLFWVFSAIFTLSLAIGSLGQSVKGRSFDVQPAPQVFPSPVATFNRQQQQFQNEQTSRANQPQFGVRLNKPAVPHPDNYMQYGVGAIEPRPILIPHDQRHSSSIPFEQQIQQNVGLGQNGTAFYAARDDQQQPKNQPNVADQNQQNWSKYMQIHPEGRNLVQNSAHNGRQTFSVEPRPPQIVHHPVPVTPQSGGSNVVQFGANFVGSTPLIYRDSVPVPQPIIDHGPTSVGEHGGQAAHPHPHQAAPSTNVTNQPGTDGVLTHRPNVQMDQQIPAIQQYEIPGQIVAPVAAPPHQQLEQIPYQPNVTGRYFSGPGPVSPGIQRYQIPVHRVGPMPSVHYHQIPQQIVAGAPAIVHRVVPASAAAQHVGPVPLYNFQRYEIPTQLVSTSRFIQPAAPSPAPGPEARVDAGLVGTPVVKAGLIDRIRFPLHGRYVKPHISTPIQYQPSRFQAQPQPPNYLMSQARPLVAQTQIYTPVFLSQAQNAHSDYRYSLTQAGGVSQQQHQPITPNHLMAAHGGQQRPAIPVSVVQQHQQPQQPLPPANNQYYRIPIETIRTNQRIPVASPVTNFFIPPYMHPYPLQPEMVTMNQPRPMYYGIGEDQNQPQAGGQQPAPVVTIEEVPRNDGKQPDGESYRNPPQPDHDQLDHAGQSLSVNDQRYFGQSSHVEYDENSSENEPQQPGDLARSEPQPQPQSQQQQQFNEGWISQEPVQQYYSDEDLRGVALNINGPQNKKKKKK